MTVLVKGHAAAAKTLKRLLVVADGPATSRSLTLTGLDQVSSLHPTLDAALNDLAHLA